MKILMLSGAYKNAGDFLIVERSRLLLKHFIPDCEIEMLMANEPLEDKLEYVNGFDWLVFPGGPGYLYNYYPDFVRLTENLDDIKPKMIAVGMGWYGVDDSDRTVNQYCFTPKTLELYQRILKDCGFLACRDNYSVRVLKNSGLERAVMTGCPAWFDIPLAEQCELRSGIDYRFKKICVSDPANIYENSGQCLELLKYLKRSYPESEIEFLFHRGTGADSNTDAFTGKLTAALKEEIQKLEITCTDISYDMERFHLYDDADLHIGYRVHAHIYNLSKRNISLLIEEDGRGAGVNEALGLPRLKAYQSKKKPSHNLAIRGMRKISKMLGFGRTEKSNPHLIENVDDCLRLLKDNEYALYPQAFSKMKEYYGIMRESIGVIDGGHAPRGTNGE